MSQAELIDDRRCSDAALISALLAIDPPGLGGAVVRSWSGPVRDRWLASTKRQFQARPWRTIPSSVSQDRLMGGLDLAATLQTGKPVTAPGLLRQADDGILVLAMAERAGAEVTAPIVQALDDIDHGFALIALDEGEEDESLPDMVSERLAFRIDLAGLRADDIEEIGTVGPDQRQRYAALALTDDQIAEIAQLAAALGIGTLRAELFCLRAARAVAALDGADHVAPDHIAQAARLVLGHRATQMPQPPEQEDQTPPDPEDPPEDPQEQQQEKSDQDELVEAAKALIPEGLLAQLAKGGKSRSAARGRGASLAKRRGRPAGSKSGKPVTGERLHISDTLRAAAPFQQLRGRMPGNRLQIRGEDFRLQRFKQRAETATIFVVDASGSAARARLNEAKGAIELLLADCYVRRDEVAMIGFRGTGAEILLPPTRSTVRAKRALSALPGGGGTPLAAGLDLGALLADQVRRKGRRPLLVLLTDGGANVDRSGQGGRAQARADAEESAKQLAAQDIPGLMVDTSPRGSAAARGLALAMAADYLALPRAEAEQLSKAVKAAPR